MNDSQLVMMLLGFILGLLTAISMLKPGHHG